MAKRPALWVEIGVTLALLTVLVAVLDAGVIYLVTRDVVLETSAAAAEDAATAVAAELSTTPEAEWARAVARHQRGGLGQLTVYGPDGAVRAGAGESGGAKVRAVFFTRQGTVDVGADGVRALVPVGAGRPVAVLELFRAGEDVVGPVWVVLLVHAAVAAVAIAVFGLSLFRRSVLRPVEDMRAATARIAAGEFGVRVPDDAPRELAELAGSLNKMSAALGEYQARTAEQLTRLEDANRELRRTQEALVRSEKLASVGRLAAGLAHELGNPLTAVRGYVELLADGAEGSADAPLLRRAQAEVERMHGLLRNLLDYAREEQRTIGPVVLGELLAEAVATVRPQPSFRGVQLDVEVEGDPIVEGEAEKLHQVLVNLLLNAGAAGARHIRARAVAVPGGAVVEVRDDGEGIPPENLPRVFDPFFTTRPPGAGTGLGLAIVHRVVEAHRGRVDVSSTVGRGTTFRLTLDGGRDAQG